LIDCEPSDVASVSYVELYGYHNLTGQLPSFVLPLFADRSRHNALFVQHVNRENIVTGFGQVDAVGCRTISRRAGPSVGDEFWAAFEWDPDDYVIARASDLTKLLIARRMPETTMTSPFLHLAIVDFCNLHDYRGAALAAAFKSLETASGDYALYWRDSIILLPALRRALADLVREQIPHRHPAERKDYLLRCIDDVRVGRRRTYPIFALPAEFLSVVEADARGWEHILSRIRKLAAFFGVEDILVRVGASGPLQDSQGSVVEYRHLFQKLNKALSDRELIERRFWLGTDQDPEDLPNLLDRIRPGLVETLEFEYIYDRGVKEAKNRFVRCAHCGRRHHYRGYVLQYPDGRRVLVGKDCGRAYYGLWFHQKEADFGAQLSRARALLKLQRVASLLPAAAKELSTVLEGEWCDRALALGRTLRMQFPNLWRRLQATSSGRLLVSTRVRDAEAEAAQDARIDREIERRARDAGYADQDEYVRRNRSLVGTDESLRKKPIYKTEPREFGRLRGYRYLATSVSEPKRRLANMLQDLDRSGKELRALQTDTLSTEALRGKLKNVQRLTSAIERVLSGLMECGSFLDASNLKTLADWANALKSGEGIYTVENGLLSLRIPSGRMFTLEATFSPVPNISALGELGRALET